MASQSVVLGYPSPGDVAARVVGPASSTDNAVTRFDGTDGKRVQNSLVTIADNGDIALPASRTVDGRDVSADGVTLDGHTSSIAANTAAIATNTSDLNLIKLFSPVTNQILLASPIPATGTTFGPVSSAGVIGTATSRTPDNTSYGSRKLRVGYVSAAGASSAAMVLFYSAYASNQGYFSRETGFAVKSGAVLSAVSATYAWMLGLGLINDFSLTTPSNRTNTVFVGADQADVNAQLMHNDASGACTKVDLGGNFPARTAGDFYDILLWCLPGNSTINYTVNRHSSAGSLFTVTGTVSGSNVPAAGSQWYVMAACNNGAAGGAVAIDSTGFNGAVPY